MTSAELAIVVLSHGPRPTLPDAVRSVLAQDVPVELLVVHTGPGDPEALLSAAGLDVPLVVDPVTRLVGAARNIGVAGTTAPYVAFLADDCFAAPGWARHRLEAHRAGAVAVSTALVAHRTDRAVPLAAHLMLQIHRNPGIPPALAARFGLSCARRVLEQVGPFREDVAPGEDADLNIRLAEFGEFVWDPRIVTAHVEPETIPRAFAEAVRRGRQYADVRTWLLPDQRFPVLTALRFRLRHLPGILPPEQRRIYWRVRPLMVALVFAYGLGDRLERRRVRRSAAVRAPLPGDAVEVERV